MVLWSLIRFHGRKCMKHHCAPSSTLLHWPLDLVDATSSSLGSALLRPSGPNALLQGWPRSHFFSTSSNLAPLQIWMNGNPYCHRLLNDKYLYTHTWKHLSASDIERYYGAYLPESYRILLRSLLEALRDFDLATESFPLNFSTVIVENGFLKLNIEKTNITSGPFDFNEVKKLFELMIVGQKTPEGIKILVLPSDLLDMFGHICSTSDICDGLNHPVAHTSAERNMIDRVHNFIMMFKAHKYRTEFQNEWIRCNFELNPPKQAIGFRAIKTYRGLSAGFLHGARNCVMHDLPKLLLSCGGRVDEAHELLDTLLNISWKDHPNGVRSFQRQLESDTHPTWAKSTHKKWESVIRQPRKLKY